MDICGSKAAPCQSDCLPTCLIKGMVKRLGITPQVTKTKAGIGRLGRWIGEVWHTNRWCRIVKRTVWRQVL